MAIHAIHPVANATSQPDDRPLMTEPTRAERMELKALAAGVRVHPARSVMTFAAMWKDMFSARRTVQSKESRWEVKVNEPVVFLTLGVVCRRKRGVGPVSSF